MIQNSRQEGIDTNGQQFCRSLVNYKEVFLRHMAHLACNKIPEVVYTKLFIQGLTSALRTQVENNVTGHMGIQDMTRHTHMTLLGETISMAQATTF